jgi:hypothetical protein
MISSRRHYLAGSLACLATFGLVVAPLLHAQLHAFEVENEHDRAAARAFRVAFEKHRDGNWYAELVEAVADAFGKDEIEGPEIDAPRRHTRGEAHHHHSHGRGAHGSGSLEHFALAIHLASAPPAPAPPESVPGTPARAPVVVHLTPRYLVPEFSQGPPPC